MKTTIITALFAILTLTLAACGGESDSDDSAREQAISLNDKGIAYFEQNDYDSASLPSVAQ